MLKKKASNDTPSSVDGADWGNLEPRAIRRQLEKVLESPLFSRSQRYTGFLRYVVEQALADPADSPKERTIGIEVFGRNPSYDSDADPVVRISAAEVRRRLSAYYADEARAGELRIEIPRGHYRPEFTPPPATPPAGYAAAELTADAPTPPAPPAPPARGYFADQPARRWLALGLVAALLLFLVGLINPGGLIRHRDPAPSIFDAFWAPALQSPTGAEISVGDLTDLFQIAGIHSTAPKTVGPDVRWTEVNWQDAQSVASISTVLGPHLRYCNRSSQTERAAVNTTPTVFVGAFDNVWTLRLTANLPLRFQGGFGKPCCSISDARDHGQTYVTSASHDYALVARLRDPAHAAERYIIAGIGPDGTLAAGDLVASPARMAQLSKVLPADWTKLNLELLVRTDITDGQPGPAIVQQAVFW